MSNSNSPDRGQEKICITATEREDGTLKLMLNLYSINFQARGFAYFSIQELDNAFAQLSNFPLRSDNLLLMAGGYFNDEGSQLISEHLSVVIRKVDDIGGLVLTAKVFLPEDEFDGARYGRGGHCDYRISYEGLSKLSESFRKILSGSSNQVEFSDFHLS